MEGRKRGKMSSGDSMYPRSDGCPNYVTNLLQTTSLLNYPNFLISAAGNQVRSPLNSTQYGSQTIKCPLKMTPHTDDVIPKSPNFVRGCSSNS